MPAESFSFMRSVFLSSFPSFLLAELFFALLYYSVINAVQFFYFLFASWTTAEVEANIEIFGPLNVTLFIVGIIAISLITCLEIATIILITVYDTNRDDHIPLRTLIRFAWERIGMIMTLRTFPLFIIVMFFPKEHIGPWGLLMLELPPFITDVIVSTPLYLIGVSLLVLVIFYIVYRSLFVIHAMLLTEDSFTLAVRRSFQMTREIGFRGMVGTMIRTVFLSSLVMLPILVLLYICSSWILSWEWLGNTAILWSSILVWLGGFLAVSIPGVLTLAMLTMLYMSHTKFREEEFLDTFHFVRSRPVHVPRFKNIRWLVKRKWALLAIIIGTGVSVFFMSILITIDSSLSRDTVIIAHRWYLMSGSTQLIENSLPAIMRAHEVGASIVEIDVYENKDGTLILSHDTTLKRVAGDPRAVSDLSNDDIAKIRLKDGSHIPTLEEVFVLAKEHNIRLIVEPKLHGKERILYDELIRLFAHYDMYDLAWIQSLSLSSLMEIREREPRIRIGYTIFGGMGNFSAIPVDFYAIQETMMNTRTINKIHSVGKEVYVWTVNNPEYIERYLRMGVDGIITDEAVRIADEVERIRSEEEENPRFVIRIFGYEIPLVSHLADS